MKVQILSCLAALALLFCLNACNQSPLNEVEQIDGKAKAEGPASLRAQLSNDVITIYDESVDLIAGQNKVAGKVNVGYDDENLYVTYATENGWVLNGVHLFVGAELPDKTAPGQFPYNFGALNSVTEFTITIPLSQLTDFFNGDPELINCLKIAAHADLERLDGSGNVIDSQTGWGKGESFDGGNNNWAMYFNFCPAKITTEISLAKKVLVDGDKVAATPDQGFEFVLERRQNPTKDWVEIGKFNVDATGQVNLGGLRPAYYRITEVEKDGWISMEGPIYLTITSINEVEWACMDSKFSTDNGPELVNYPVPVVLPQDETVCVAFAKEKFVPTFNGNGITSGVAADEFSFNLFKINELGVSVLIGTYSTDADGKVTACDLEPGEYQFKEVANGNWGIQTVSFSIDDQGVVSGIEEGKVVLNKPQLGESFGSVTATNEGNRPAILAGLSPKNGNPLFDKKNPEDPTKSTPFVVPYSNHFVFAKVTRASLEAGINLDFMVGSNYDLVGTGTAKLVNGQIEISINNFAGGDFGAVAFNQLPVFANGNIHSQKLADLATFGAKAGFNHDNNAVIPCPSGNTIYLYIHCGTLQFYKNVN